MKNWLVIGGLMLGLGYWLWRGITAPRPGEAIADLGRDHVPVGTSVQYNSNPPTSGPHFSQWTKRGVYDQPIEDGYLIHSLEHGYIVVSYNCTKLPISDAKFLISKVYAHEEGDDIPAGEPHEASESGNQDIESSECSQLESELREFYERRKNKRLIVVPRPSLDVPIALTAWNRILKLPAWDEAQAEAFVRAFDNRGPEKTME